MRRIALLLLFLLILYTGFYFHIHSKRSHFFNPSFITYDPGLWPKLKVQELNEEKRQFLNGLFKHSFKFLGSGNQVFAFESDDGTYVVKFFKFQHLRETSPKSLESKQHRIKQIFLGHFNAYELSQKNSGMVYVHLNPQERLGLEATLFDYTGFKHTVSLDDLVFAVQKKGESCKRVLSQLLSRGQLQEAQKHITALINMYLEDYKLGLYDRDHNVMNNTGFIDGVPLRIDIGKLKYLEEMKKREVYQADLKKVEERINKWVKKSYPAYSQAIAETIGQFLIDI